MAIIRRLLEEGKDVTVAIRALDRTRTDPYTAHQTAWQIKQIFPNLETIWLPPFDEIVHGREPGWSVREIEIDEPISATDLRGGAIIWITGQSGSGKTTLANALKQHFLPSAVILDGDEMRKTISTEEGFSAEDRESHNRRVGRLAALLRDQGHIVLVSVIAPYVALRRSLTEMYDPIWVYTPGESQEALEGDWPYEEPLPDEAVVHAYRIDEKYPDQVGGYFQMVAETFGWIADRLGIRNGGIE